MRQIVLEVERKFISTVETRRILQNYNGQTPFKHLRDLGTNSFTDTYFDRQQLLHNHGIWLRQRDNQWQAKVRMSGDYQNSRFHEIEGKDQIIRTLQGVGLDCSATDLVNFGLNQTAKFTSIRHKWLADGAFTVVLDETDFGHSVGEVELEQIVMSDIVDRGHLMEDMDRSIEAFMKRYHAVFLPGKPEGKLSAYFRHYGHIV